MDISEDGENKNDDDKTYTDITAIFEGAVSTLSYTNPILCDDSSFNLYDTMAALELMDTKMDSCEIDASFYRYPPTSPNDQNKNKNKNDGDDDKNDKNDDEEDKGKVGSSMNRITVPPRPAPKKLNDDLTTLPWENLNINQARIIIMEMSTRFESMVSGSNIAESVYTCLYAHDDILEDMKGRLEHESNYNYEHEFDNDIQKDDTDNTKLPSKEEIRAARWSVYASALMLVKLTQLVRRIVQHADIYEEEDFSLSTYNFTFFKHGGMRQHGVRQFYTNVHSNNDSDVNNDGGTDRLLDVFKVCIAAKDAIKGVLVEDVGTQECQDYSMASNLNIIERVLDFYIDLYNSCAILGKLTKVNVLEQATSVKQTIEKGLKNLDTLIKMVHTREEQDKKTLDTSQKTNTKPETTTKQTETQQPYNNHNNERAIILLQTFDPNVNRHLLGNSPVRKVDFRTPLQSLRYLRTLFHTIDWAVCDLLLRGDNIDRIRRMLSHVSTSTDELNGSVNILVRSLVVLNLYFDDLLLGRHILPLEIARHMHRHGVPKPITDTVYGIKLLERLGKPMYDTLKVLTLNRNRQRAYLEAAMFSEWGTLQQEAALVDREFCEEFQLGGVGGAGSTTMPFVTNYVLGLTVGLMVHYLTLGIELDVVTGHYDLTTTYWYLDFLLTTQLNLANGMRDSMRERRALQAKIAAEGAAAAAEAAAAANNGASAKGRPSSSGSKSDKGKKRGGKKSNKRGGNNSATATRKNIAATKPVEIEVTPEEKEDDLELLMLEMRRTKCRGIVRFISALNQAEIVTPPNYTFTTHEICFQKRFHSFRLIHQPRLLTFDDFQAGSDFSSVLPKDLLVSTTECFKTCRAIVDVILKRHLTTIDQEYCAIRRKEALSLVKVCVGNSLYLHKLCQVVEEGGDKVASCKASFSFKAHKQFCSITLS